MATVGTVLVDVKADTTHLVEGMKKAQASMKQIGDNAKDLAKIFGGIVVIDMFRNQITQTLQYADSLSKLSQKTGISTNELYSLSAAAKLSDVEFGALESSMAKFSKGIGEASMGTGDAQKAFERLGISIQNQDGSLKGSFSLLGELSAKFKEMPDGAMKATTAMELFGKSGASMIPLLNSGKEALEEYLGVMDDETGKASESFNDSMTKLGLASNTFYMKIVKDVSPVLKVLSEDISNATKETNSLISALEKLSSNSIIGVIERGYAIKGAVEAYGGLASGMVGAAWDATFVTFDEAGKKWNKTLNQFQADIKKTSTKIKELNDVQTPGYAQQNQSKQDSIGDYSNDLLGRMSSSSDAGKEYWEKVFEEQKATFEKGKETAKKAAEEYKKFNDEQFALLALGSDKSFKQLDAGAIDYKEIEANAKTALDNMADKYQTYYETIGEYAKSWELKKFELSEKYNMLSTEELDKFLGKQEELYMSSFTKQKTEAQQAAEAMYQAFNGIHRQLESSFMSFFDHTSDKFMEFGDLATSILNQIINEMIRMSIVTPMVNSLMGMIGPTLGIGTGTTSTSSVATVPQSYFRWQGGMFADGYLAGNGYASYDSIANDKIPALISKGEAVIPASVVNSNRELIASLIASRGQKFANGYMPHGSDLEGNIKVQIINESGQDMNVTSTRQSMDAEGMVLGIVIDGISKNKMGLRDMIGGR